MTSRGPSPFAESLTEFRNLEDAAVDSGSAQRRRIALAVALTSVVGVVAAMIVLYLTVERWLSAQEALTWMVVGAILPTTILGVLLVWPADQKLNLKLALSGLTPVILVSVGALLLSSSWAVPSTRLQFVSFAVDDPHMADIVLRDSSEEVAVKACQVVAPRFENPAWHLALSSVLTTHPGVATRCLNGAEESVQRAFAPSLATRWSRQLAAQGDGADLDAMCDIASALPQLPLARPELDARLLHCTLSAPTEQAQRCCGTALAATVSGPEQWVEHLEETVGMVRDEDVVQGVYVMAFHQQGLTPAQLAFSNAVDFQGPAAQRVALAYACDAIVHGSPRIIAHLGAGLEGNCEIDASDLPQSRPLWTDICSDTLTHLKANPTHDVNETLCDATRDTLVESAVTTASDLLGLATEKDVLSRMSKSIDEGYERVLEHLATPEGIIEGAPDWVPQADVERMRGQVKFH